MKDIRWLMVSHFHIDHAGLAGMFVDNGVKFYVFRHQVSAIDEMESLMERKHMIFRRIDPRRIHVLETPASRALLASIGVQGEVLETKGHAWHCVSLLLDSGEAFVGDLPPEGMIREDDSESRHDWQQLRLKGARLIKPAHGNEFVLN